MPSRPHAVRVRVGSPLVALFLSITAGYLGACGAAPAPTVGGSVAVTTGDPEAPTSWAMPDLAGLDLQSAQDTVQQLSGYGIAITTAHDLHGDREQVFDRDWHVCTQSVAAGDEITADTMIDFGVVPLTETCG